MSQQERAEQCDHGSLKRSCYVCELEAEVEAKDKEIAALRSHLEAFVREFPGNTGPRANMLELARATLKGDPQT